MRTDEETGDSGDPLIDNKDKRTFLFLQGPMSPFFSRLAERLRAQGHDAHRINLGFGDWLFWRAGGAHNYRGRKSNWPNYVEEFLKNKNVTDVILLGDCRSYHRIAIEKAKALGIEVTIIELGYLRPNWLTMERYGMSSLSHFPNDPKKILAIAKEVEEVQPPQADRQPYFARMAFWDVLYKLSTVFLFWLYPFYKLHSLYHPSMSMPSGLLDCLKRRKEKRRQLKSSTIWLRTNRRDPTSFMLFK